jgi:hypothetical protein
LTCNSAAAPAKTAAKAGILAVDLMILGSNTQSKQQLHSPQVNRTAAAAD